MNSLIIQGERGLTGAKGEKGDQGQAGRDGVTPTVTVKDNKDDGTHKSSPDLPLPPLMVLYLSTIALIY